MKKKQPTQEQYRAAAQFIAAKIDGARVEPFADVQPMADGAFVSITVWIPASVVTGAVHG